MLNEIFKGLFDTTSTTVISVSDFLICIFSALLLGGIIALSYIVANKYTKSFVSTLALLPAVVCVVIMMVNGNIGIGVAVAGAFGLVRFRSAAGTAKEIGVLFLSMGTGLIIGTGYIAFAVLYTLILCAFNLVYSLIGNITVQRTSPYKSLRIVIPEDLDYEEIFDDIFKEFTSYYELTTVKTTNMGSMFKLTYDIKMKKKGMEKKMIDKIRCRNGNLEISLSKQAVADSEL